MLRAEQFGWRCGALGLSLFEATSLGLPAKTLLVENPHPYSIFPKSTGRFWDETWSRAETVRAKERYQGPTFGQGSVLANKAFFYLPKGSSPSI